MKNTLGGRFYFFQARRGGPTTVRSTTHPNTCEVVPISHIVFTDFRQAKTQMARQAESLFYPVGSAMPLASCRITAYPCC